MTNDGSALATGWSYRPSLFFLASLAGAVALQAALGVRARPGAVLIVVAGFVWALRGISVMTVHRDRIVLRLGPFGLVRREVARDNALLWTFHSFLFRALTIKRLDKHLVGPFGSVTIQDRWPEAELRAAGYRYQD